ncbi:MaoC family dehydratase N-terminal domain-containing protein [Kribbella shirazensis]|uniref:Acyl dehydratase n=1 Tax=Kribbella shirazensis TaxID=1105143 RepID=A0A7X5VHR9_9ACTN|nr:MaoC family dehydratase N-terminal domain-containing protein [Kribbella shirazensis]NIK61453.1 acyl dehydratase [Kribbella shirazensis]
MLISTDVIGRQLAVADVTIDRGRVRRFALAIGETDPVFSELEAARKAGYPDLPVPPTFLFCADLEICEPLTMLANLGADVRQVLHGEQSFVYFAPVHAGETVTLRAHIADVYTRKGGRLEFLTRETTVSRGDGTTVAELSSTLVVKNPEAV